MVLWRGDRINGWVAGIASHGSGFLSRGWLDTIEAPVGISGSHLHYTAMQLIIGLYPEPQKLVISRFVFWDQNSHIFLFPGFFQQH